MVSVTLTAADMPGADLSELLVLFWHRYRESAWNKLCDCDLSCLASIQNTLNRLGLLPGSLGNRWKKVLGSWLGLLPQHLQVCPAYCVVLVRTSTDSHSLHTVFTARSLVSHHSHMNCVIGMVSVTRRFQTAPLPILPFTAILNVATKEQPDVMSRESNSFTLVCNWLIW